MSDDTLTPEQIRERDGINDAWREVLSTQAGQRVVFWWLEQCAIYQEAFAGDSTNTTNYTLGLQSAGRKAIARMDAIDPRLYPKLLTDVAEIRVMDKAAAERATDNEREDDDEIA